MEEDITIFKEESTSDAQMSNPAGLEVLPASDPLECPEASPISHKSPSEAEVNSLELPCEPKNQHLNAICLNIRIAIIRYFYSSSSCPTTALQRLKEEDNQLCVTVNVEDVNFFVQKFEKTGSVIGNNMESSTVETEDAVNPHSVVETVFGVAITKGSRTIIESDSESEDTANPVFLSDETSQDRQQRPKKAKKRRKFRLNKKRKLDHEFHPNSKTDQKSSKSQDESLNCKLCNRHFDKISLLTDHIIEHSNQTLNCALCSQKYSTYYDLVAHVRSHTEDKRYKCTKCPYRATKPAYIKDHLRAKHGVSSFECNVCSEEFDNFRILKKHMLKNHPGIPISICVDNSSEDSIATAELRKNPDTIIDQQVSNSQDEKVKCKLCNKSFESISLLTKHIIGHSNETLNCALCNQRFSTYYALLIHVRSHTEDKHYRCNKCPFRATRPVNLKTHLRSKHGISSFKCDGCPEEFAFFKYYRKHMIENHPGIPISLCADDSIATRPADSITPMDVNKDSIPEISTSYIGPFNCKQCRKSFDKMEDLRSHIDCFPSSNPSNEEIDLSKKNSMFLPNPESQMANAHQQLEPHHLGIAWNVSEHREAAHEYPLTVSQNEITSSTSQEQTAKKINESHQTSKNKCRICGKEFPSNTKIFTYHVLSHFNMTFLPKDGPHKCPGCHASFALDFIFYYHLINDCNFEKYDFSQKQQNEDTTQNSRLMHDSFATANLSDIPKEDHWLFYGQSSRTLHHQIEQREHEVNENFSSSHSSNKEIHKCPRCFKILPDKRSLTYHVADHFDLSHLDGNPPYKCPGGCNQLFYREDSLYTHLVITCHKGKKLSKTPFNCHLCSKAFQFEIQREHHLLVHSGKAKLKECHICTKKFNTTTGFRNHLLTNHSKKKGYQCDQCHRNFLRLRYLEEHKLSHLGTYLYTCETCGKKSDTSQSHRKHLESHKMKSCQCEICGKTFSGKSAYKKHKRTHTGEIVAVCDLCGKGFNRRDNLRTHYKSCQRQMLPNQDLSR